MSQVRDVSNPWKAKDLTDSIVNLPVLNGMINALGLFNERSTASKAIIFEKDTRSYSLLPQTSRSARNASVGKDRSSQLFTLALPYFKHKDHLTPEDIQDHIAYGQFDMTQTLANAIAAKTEDMRIRADQTKEFMKLSALKGTTVDAEGNTIANMFSEFGVSQDTVDFTLGTTTTDITAKINSVLRTAASNNKAGVALTKPFVICGNTFFDKLVSHADVEAAYAQYRQEDGVQRLRDMLFDFRDYGAIASFTHRGVTFVNHQPTFTAPDGSTLTPIAAADGYVVFPEARDLYRGYNGPSNKLSGANRPGAPMYMYQYEDAKDEGIEFELEMSPLYFMTNPKMSIKVTTSD